MSAYNFVRCGPNFTKIFLFNAQKDRFHHRRLHIVAIFIGSRDICAQTRKLS